MGDKMERGKPQQSKIGNAANEIKICSCKKCKMYFLNLTKSVLFILEKGNDELWLVKLQFKFTR